MTIDKTIKDLKGEYSSPYNNQLAEWLEELKELRRGYNKAIDDFTDVLTDHGENVPLTHCKAQFCKGKCSDCIEEIRNVANKLQRSDTE